GLDTGIEDIWTDQRFPISFALLSLLAVFSEPGYDRSNSIPRLFRKQPSDFAGRGHENRASLLRRQAGISERELGHRGLYVREPRPRRHLSVPRRSGTRRRVGLGRR